MHKYCASIAYYQYYQCKELLPAHLRIRYRLHVTGFKYRMLKCCGHFECKDLKPGTCNRLHARQELAMNVINHIHQAVGLLKNFQLAVGAGAFFHQFSNIINSMAATQFIYHIINKI